MELRSAFDLGHQTAAAGFFFDGMEVIAAAAPSAGGLDALRPAIACVAAQGRDAHDRMRDVCSILSDVARVPTQLPQGVDDYRRLLTHGVFDVVNRWSYLNDIRQVTRLQAWFYAGFGLGRARSVLLALPLMVTLRDIVGVAGPVVSMPSTLQRLLAEAIKQLEVAAAEHDLDPVRPLLSELAIGLKPVCVRLLLSAGEIDLRPDDGELLVDCRRVEEAVRTRLYAASARVPA